MKQSGGYIWVYCELKLGTTFKIYLPRLNAKGIPVPPAVLAESVPTGCETIPLVEDEAAVRASTREFLQSIGYIVLEARNAQDALELAREYDNPIDLLISDVVMPGMSGAKLASVLTAQRPEMRVFFLSGYAESTVLRHGNVDVGARLLQKPFSLRAMVRLRKVLESHSAPAISVCAAGAAR